MSGERPFLSARLRITGETTVGNVALHRNFATEGIISGKGAVDGFCSEINVKASITQIIFTHAVTHIGRRVPWVGTLAASVASPV